MGRLLVLLLACVLAGTVCAPASAPAQPSRAEKIAFCVVLTAREIAEFRQDGCSRAEILAPYLARAAGTDDAEGAAAYEDMIRMVVDCAFEQEVFESGEFRKQAALQLAQKAGRECKGVIDKEP